MSDDTGNRRPLVRPVSLCSRRGERELMRFGLFCGAVLAGVMLLMGDGAAQQQEHGSGNIPDVDEQIASCAAVIPSGQETTESQAVAYNNGGNACAAQGDNDRAI